MRISLDELVRQQHNIGCWFDRKTYTICHCDPPDADDLPYRRYIPMFQIDWNMIYIDFVDDLNDGHIKTRWKHSGLSVSAFIEREDLERCWFEYLYAAKRKLAIQWCQENNIRYEGEHAVEDQ